MDLFGQVFLLKKYQRTTPKDIFQKFLQDLKDNSVYVVSDKDSSIFKQTIQQCTASPNDTKKQKHITAIIEFIKENGQYGQFYRKLISYSSHPDQSIVQDKLVQLLNIQDIFPYILSFLDIPNTTLLFHSRKPLMISRLTEDRLQWVILDHSKGNGKHLGCCLHCITSIEIGLNGDDDDDDVTNKKTESIINWMEVAHLNRVNSVKINAHTETMLLKLVNYLSLCEIDKQLQHFEVNGDGEFFWVTLEFAGECITAQKLSLIDLTNCEKLSLNAPIKSASIKISNKCRILGLSDTWTKEQFVDCDFSGVETLCLHDFGIIDNYKMINLANVKKLIVHWNNTYKNVLEFYNQTNIERILKKNNGSIMVYLSRVESERESKDLDMDRDLDACDLNVISGIDIEWEHYNYISRYVSIENLFVKPQIQRGIKLLRFSISKIDRERDNLFGAIDYGSDDYDMTMTIQPIEMDII